jgi:tetratricopeptide (TPR) repeat protein
MNNQQNNDKSLDYTLKALDIYRYHCPDEKNDIMSCYLLHAFCLFRKGQFDESIENAQIALNMSNELNSFPDLIKANRILGLCFYFKADYAKALTKTKTSIMIYEKISTSDETAAEIYQTMARCLLKLKKYDDALEFGRKVLMIREKLLPLLHRQRAESYCTVALLDYHCDNEEESNALCQKAENILKELVENNGETDNISYSFEDLAELFLLRGEMDKVQKYYEKAMDHLNIEKGNSHPEVKRLQGVLYGLVRL